MTEYLDNNFNAFGITRTTMDIPTIEETDTERIELILKNQATMPKILAHIDTVVHDDQCKTRFHLKIVLPERTISYNRLPSKAWLYLFTQTQSVLIVKQEGGGGAKAIATCANIDVTTLMDKKIEFGI
jgi:hypothetical protein